MKYPLNQFNALIEVLKQLAMVIDLTSISPETLYYMAFQQLNEHQKHNHLYCLGNSVKRYHQLTNEEKLNFVKLVNLDLDFEFKCYPEGCNDKHISTVMKKVIKELV